MIRPSSTHGTIAVYISFTMLPLIVGKNTVARKGYKEAANVSQDSLINYDLK